MLSAASKPRLASQVASRASPAMLARHSSARMPLAVSMAKTPSAVGGAPGAAMPAQASRSCW